MITDLDSQKVSKTTRYVFVGHINDDVRKYWHADTDIDDDSLWHVAQALERDELHHYAKPADKPRHRAPFNPISTFCVGLGVIGACYFLILGAVWCVIKLIGG
jgi:hypothetical protein